MNGGKVDSSKKEIASKSDEDMEIELRKDEKERESIDEQKIESSKGNQEIELEEDGKSGAAPSKQIAEKSSKVDSAMKVATSKKKPKQVKKRARIVQQESSDDEGHLPVSHFELHHTVNTHFINTMYLIVFLCQLPDSPIKEKSNGKSSTSPVNGRSKILSDSESESEDKNNKEQESKEAAKRKDEETESPKNAKTEKKVTNKTSSFFGKSYTFSCEYHSYKPSLIYFIYIVDKKVKEKNLNEDKPAKSPKNVESEKKSPRTMNSFFGKLDSVYYIFSS